MRHIDFHPPIPKDRVAKRLSEEPYLHDNVQIRDSKLGVYTELFEGVQFVESVLGDYSYAGEFCDIIYTTIGKFANIASYVRLNPGNHPTWRVTQHHFTYRRAMYGFGEDDADFFQWRREQPVHIGHDTWSGHGVPVMAGVTIGVGAAVGSGAVVTKDVAPFEIVVGVPAKPLRKRFDDRTVEALMGIAWWDWGHETLKARFDDFLDLDVFLEKYG